MKIEELGAKTKAKYPQYANMSDTEVGEKMLAKYPTYQKQIDNDASIGKGLYNLIVNPTVQGIKGYGELVGSAGMTKMSQLGGLMGKGNTNQALQEAEALKQARLSGNTDLGKQLAQQSKQRYQTSGQSADSALSQGQMMGETANTLRQKSGLSGSFDQGLGSGLSTVGMGTLKGAGGVLSALDLATLGSSSSLSAGLKYAGKRATQNLLANAVTQGAGETAEALRKGTDVGEAAWRGASGQGNTGLIEGVTGDTKFAPAADAVLNIALPLLLGKAIDKTAQKVVDAPGKAFTQVKNLLPKSKTGVLGQTPEELAASYFGSSYQLDKVERRKFRPQETYKEIVNYGFKGTPAEIAQKSKDINFKVINPAIEEAIENSNETVNITGVMDKSREIIKKRPSLFRNTKQNNALISGLGSEFDVNPERGIATIPAKNLLQGQKNIASQAEEYYQAWRKSGRVKDKALYDFYNEASKGAKKLLDELQGNQQLLQQSTPRVVEELQQYSPKLADAYSKAQTLSQKRSLMAPFVRMGKIADTTLEKINNSGALSNPATRTALALTLGTSTGNPLVGMAGWLAAPILNPLINSTTARAQSGIAQKVLDPSSKMGALVRMLSK